MSQPPDRTYLEEQFEAQLRHRHRQLNIARFVLASFDAHTKGEIGFEELRDRCARVGMTTLPEPESPAT